MSIKNVDDFVAQDQPGHIAMSGQELLNHASMEDPVSILERKNYFYGISCLFPIMLLSHYHCWNLDTTDEEYMKFFKSFVENKYGLFVEQALDDYYSGRCTFADFLKTYLTSYPYAILLEYTCYAGNRDLVKKANAFIEEDRKKHLLETLKQAADCSEEERRKLVV